MSRGMFYSHNKVGETMSFKTNSAGAPFDPRVSFGYGGDRVSWDLGNGSGYTAGNIISYTYPDSTTKTVTLRTNRLERLEAIDAEQENIVGNLDLSGWVNLADGPVPVNNYNQFGVNSQLTGITNPVSSQIITHYNIYNSDITGVLVMTGITNLGGYFDVSLNSNLTNILHGPSNQAFTNRYHAYSCPSLTGNLDLSMLTGLGASFSVVSDINLTGITHTASTQVFTLYNASGCDLTGNLDLSMLTKLGGTFYVYDNNNLTSITHTASTQVFNGGYYARDNDLTGNHDIPLNIKDYFYINNNSNLTSITHHPSLTGEIIKRYYANGCNLTGNHDVSALKLKEVFVIFDNFNLTGITHSVSTETIVDYYAYDCNLTGNHNLTMFPNFGGQLWIYENSALTNIIHTASTETFIDYWAYNCGLIGNLDLSMLSGLGGDFRIYGNNLLENITHPVSTGTFSKYYAYGCILSFIDFFPLSGATMSDIQLWDNGMTSTEVNTILWDFYELNDVYGQVGWSGCTLHIGGTNNAPTVGPPDGITAKDRLINDYDWTITSS